ncbi:MAG: ATP synthase subunit I [Saezia sp.]
MSQLTGTQEIDSQKNKEIVSDDELEAEELSYKVLTRSEAQLLEASMPRICLWFVVRVQFLMGLVVVFIASFFGWWAGFCAAAGVFSVVLPTVLFVWRVGAVGAGRYGSHFSLVNFYLWEFVKIMGIIAMLVAGFLWIKPLIWQALLAGFVVTVKAYGIGCWLSLRKNKQVSN